MEKTVKTKAAKKSSKWKAELPELVTVMMKVAERLELLERKVDLATQAISRLSQTSSFVSARAEAQQPKPQPQQHQSSAHNHENGRKERIMHKVVCADCGKNCEVPFKPGEGRPVYCKACFVIRKAGHVPQDPDRRSQGPAHPRPITTIPRDADPGTVFPSGGKSSKGKKTKAKKVSKKKKK